MGTRHLEFWPSVPHRLTPPETSVWFNAEVSAARFPNKTCLNYYDSAITFAAFRREAERLAGFLQKECGVRRGDRVALYLQNSPQFVIGYYAILRADAMVVPINPMNLTKEVGHIVQDSGATVLFAAQDDPTMPSLSRIQPLIGNALSHVIVACYSDHLTVPTDLEVPAWIKAPRQSQTGAGLTLWSDAMAAAAAPGPHLAGPDDLCVMPYTSGTTGNPKGCVHRHRSVMFTTVAGPQWNRTFQDETILSILPYFHATGMQGGMNAPIYAGVSIVLLPRWDRDTAAQLIERYRITSWTNIATMAIDFLANPNLARYDISSLKRIGGGGAAMPEAVAQRLQELTGLDYVEGYGLSETIAPTHINPPDRAKKQCLGIPICDTDARVINPDTLAELGVGEVGEIVSSGPQIFRGYWKIPEATAACFIEIDGKRFFRTGDLGYYDEEGYFFIVDRLKRMINASGYKVWPAEVEAILYGNPHVQEACIISTSDSLRGETVKAVIVLKATSR